MPEDIIIRYKALCTLEDEFILEYSRLDDSAESQQKKQTLRELLHWREERAYSLCKQIHSLSNSPNKDTRYQHKLGTNILYFPGHKPDKSAE